MKRPLSFSIVLFIGLLLLTRSYPAFSQLYAEQASKLFSHLSYRCVGPTRGGRVTAVAGVPSRPGTIYLGATGGGVWKSVDYGQSWQNVSDGYFQSPSIGSIRVAPSNPDIVYVGTGSDGLRSNVIAGCGVYKSTDGGRTWNWLGLKETMHIGAVLIHPEDSDIVYVAAIGEAFKPTPQRGVYRTQDGGQSWEKVLFISDSTGIVDLEFAPDNPDEIYASAWRAERKPWTIISGGREGGIYKSDDGGGAWHKLSNGLPRGLLGKSDLAVSAADPERVYALVEAPAGEGGLYRSDDRGRTFRLISDYRPLLARPFYYCNVDADPMNADLVYVNAEGFFRSEDGGKSWQRRSTPHGDNHDMWINPHDSDLFIQSNDGGANVTRDGGRTWSTQMNQPTAELYQVNVDDDFPYWLYAGQQDASTIKVPSLPLSGSITGQPGYWRSIGGCETGPAVPKPGDPDIVYASCKGRFGVYNFRTGQEKQYYVGAVDMYGHNPKDLRYRFQRVAPILVSPYDPDLVYHASQFLHRTRDGGITWETISPDLTANPREAQVFSGGPITRDITGEEVYSTIYALAESPLVQGVIWTGSNDGLVYVTRDGGAHWLNVTPSDLPPGGRVQTVEASPHDPARAYIAVYRYLLGDWKPYIYRTDNYGDSWSVLSGDGSGIPADCPARVVREDPVRPGLLYSGTERGMFISFDDGGSWIPFQRNLPVTPVTDIKIFRDDLILSTMGRSFWIMDDITSLREMDAGLVNKRVKLLTPRDAFRLRYRSWETGSVPVFPPAGVMLEYWLKDNEQAEMTLDILDSAGTLIRRFSSQRAKPEKKTPPLSTSTIFSLQEYGTSRLSLDQGMHRVVWDMRHPGAYSERLAGRGSRGPLVSPGIYTARLRFENTEHTVVFRILMDPRVAESGVTMADLREQESLSLRIRDVLSRARLASAVIKQKLKDLVGEKALSREEQKRNELLSSLEERLETRDDIAYPTPMLIDQISYLAGMLDRADQRPGKDAWERYEELNKELERIIAAVSQ